MMSPSSGHSSASGELWGFALMPNRVTVDVLLPTGIFITIDTSRECTLLDLKSKVWELAEQQPLFQLLLDQAVYIFVGVTKDAEREEFYNEQRRLCDMHLFQPMMKLIEAKGNREEKIFKRTITQTIGMSVDEFSRLKKTEVNDFRRNISVLCRREVEARNAKTDPHSMISYYFPPRVESSEELPLHTTNNLSGQNSILIRVWIVQKNSLQRHATVRVGCEVPPFTIIAEVLRKKSRGKSLEQAMNNKDMQINYVLKICGVNEYLEGNYPIVRYKYIRQCVNRDITPDLMLTNTCDIISQIPDYQEYMEPKLSKYRQENSPKGFKSLLSLSVTEVFKVRIKSGSYLNVNDTNLYVCANIYHGTTQLCSFQRTMELDGAEAPKWNQWLTFQISLCDIPRGAKLCLSVCGLRRKKEEHWPLAWANLPLFDYQGHLLQEPCTVRLWYPPCHMEGLLNPIGVSGSNPTVDTSPCLQIEFDHFGTVIGFPEEKAKLNISGDYTDVSSNSSNFNNTLNPVINNSEDIQNATVFILSIIERDPLSMLSDEEKDQMWSLRAICKRIPESLPKLLQSVQWEERKCVEEIYTMLSSWSYLSPEVALELLDSKYPDPVVRKFATKCLEDGLNDDGILKYLLQLVTVLKFESYLDSPLLRFLLSKAITNQKVGHYFFWHLKSEMHDPQVSLRFGLILEAYCRSCGSYLDQLLKQTDTLQKLINVNAILQKDDTMPQKILKDNLNKTDYQELLKDNLSPLNPAVKLGELCTELCEVKTSAKRPIILQWFSKDPLAEQFQPKHGILFKNGDDLRQDMLTLQILRVMDDIWQSDDLDLCISPYVCISMGQNVGMIEIVPNAETIMSVQKKGGVVGSLQLKSGTIHQWLKDNNSGEKQYNKAIYNFTRSCAGYCVATLVLGIADRHNDNIMIKKNGQMFHIDFGHFLNHKKKKYGIVRNRVPFVLPGDFMRVICRGSTSDFTKTSEYKHFQDLCCRAYLSIRSRANVIINLLCMMLGAGIPELSCFDDIEYVRNSLAVEKNRDDALQYFQTCLAAAQNKQWTTKVDWVCHAVKHSVLK